MGVDLPRIGSVPLDEVEGERSVRLDRSASSAARFGGSHPVGQVIDDEGPAGEAVAASGWVGVGVGLLRVGGVEPVDLVAALGLHVAALPLRRLVPPAVQPVRVGFAVACVQGARPEARVVGVTVGDLGRVAVVGGVAEQVDRRLCGGAARVAVPPCGLVAGLDVAGAEHGRKVYCVQVGISYHQRSDAWTSHDGQFGNHTLSQVRNFQGDLGLSVDGKVGKNAGSEVLWGIEHAKVEKNGPWTTPWGVSIDNCYQVVPSHF